VGGWGGGYAGYERVSVVQYQQYIDEWWLSMYCVVVREFVNFRRQNFNVCDLDLADFTVEFSIGGNTDENTECSWCGYFAQKCCCFEIRKNRPVSQRVVLMVCFECQWGCGEDMWFELHLDPKHIVSCCTKSGGAALKKMHVVVFSTQVVTSCATERESRFEAFRFISTPIDCPRDSFHGRYY
jgi:hypothetical protein